MSAAKTFRERYGISQPDLAVYLSISLSLLKQVEINTRSLPTPALLKLGTVALYEVQAATAKPPAEATTASIPNKKLERATRKATLQLYLAQQQLEKAQKKYAQAQQLLELCNYLLAQNPTDEVDKLWLEGQQLSARHKLKTNGKEEQALLQWKVACLQFAIQKSHEITTAIEDDVAEPQPS